MNRRFTKEKTGLTTYTNKKCFISLMFKLDTFTHTSNGQTKMSDNVKY